LEALYWQKLSGSPLY